MTKKQYRDKIEKLLRKSHDRGDGPHGKTIYSVMQQVDSICSFVSVPAVHLKIRKPE